MSDLHPLKVALLVGLGGGLGALTRHYVGAGAKRWLGEGWPIGTLVVNLIGSLVLGVLAGCVASRQSVSAETRAFVMVGFLGALTTFSTFSVEGVTLLREAASPVSGLAYIGVSVVAGLALAYLGYRLGS
jgi:CrcB protein